MFQKLWLFLTNAEAFDRATSGGGARLAALWERAKTPLKMGLLTLGSAGAMGQLNLGPKFWWVTPGIIGVSALIQKTQKGEALTPEGLAAAFAGFTDAQKAHVVTQLAPKVP